MSKRSDPTEAFVASLSTADRRKRELVLELSPEERATLPSRMRALAADEHTLAWSQAKADRDAAIDAALARVNPADPDSDYVIADAETRAAAIVEAREAWAARKGELLAEG